MYHECVLVMYYPSEPQSMPPSQIWADRGVQAYANPEVVNARRDVINLRSHANW